jgi:hypothetical protein
MKLVSKSKLQLLLRVGLLLALVPRPPRAPNLGLLLRLWLWFAL